MFNHQKDTNTRPFANIKDLSEGMVVEIDGGFTCADAGYVELLKDEDNGKLYFECSDGKHFLSGQMESDSNTVIGVYTIDPANKSPVPTKLSDVKVGDVLIVNKGWHRQEDTVHLVKQTNDGELYIHCDGVDVLLTFETGYEDDILGSMRLHVRQDD